MKNTPRQFARILGFAAALVLLVCFANTFLVRTDSVTAMTLREMHAREDIKLALVGSSIVRYHFNPEIISRDTGLRTFDASVLSCSLQGDIAVTRELLQTNHPQWIALVLDCYSLESAKEDLEAEYVLMPHLHDPRVKLDYYLSLCKQDGLYFNRLMLFRDFGVQSFEQLARTVGMRFAPEATFEAIMAEQAPEIAYMGDGYERHTTDATPEQAIRRRMFRNDIELYYELLPATQALLVQYRALCDEAGVNLMIVIAPNHTVHSLAENSFLHYSDALQAYCRHNGIPCLNFIYANENLLPRMDGYYYDLYHMTGEGSDLFSAAFAKMFNLLSAGEDVSAWFYPSQWEYLHAIDFITNVWIDPANGEADGQWLADCNRGPEVAPEYRFTLRAADGSETLLRDYDPDPAFCFDIPEGCDLRVYARPQGDADAEASYYDYPTDYALRYE